MEDKTITIFTDSQVTLNALRKQTPPITPFHQSNEGERAEMRMTN
jgi:hypothetical protein